MTVDPTFSQRYGYQSLPKPMQAEELSDDLRRELWNLFSDVLSGSIILSPYGNSRSFSLEAQIWIQCLLGKLLRKPKDEIDMDCDWVIAAFKERIYNPNCPFYITLDVVESFVNTEEFEEIYGPDFESYIDDIRQLFEVHMAAYYLSKGRPYQIISRSNLAQGKATGQAIETVRDSGMEGADTHLRRSVEHLNTQQYADSIRESIHAVESVARTICPDKNTLGDALKSLERKGLVVHPALKEAFQKLYAYSNDEQGIRHALLEDEAKVGLDEALFMFGACASFAAFLVAKYQELDRQADDER